MNQRGPHISRHGLERHGIGNVAAAHWNYRRPALYEEAVRRGEAQIAEGGALIAMTGTHTGRSPNDKYIVREPSSEHDIWWGDVNRPISRDAFNDIHGRVAAYLQGKEVFVQDCHVGADSEYRLPVRVVSEFAWHSLFARNLFITPPAEELADHEPDFTIVQVPGFKARPETDGTNSETVVLLDFARRLVLIGGTAYAGECKKSVFTIMNFLMPARDVLPMHCSVSVGEDGTPAVFFGLSGTGKTTLSADPQRMLLGDDEHGWSQDGLFNFEGGCYAKVIKLSPTAEPAIHATTRMFGTVLENVVMDADTHILDLDDGSRTENTRGAYPLASIPNASPTGVTGHPTNIVMLTADAFGVLPPIARLTPEQAIYHFLSGYTAKVAGTERGPGQGAAGDLLHLFRRTLHAAPADSLCAPAARAYRDDRSRVLARQYRLDRRPLRHRRAHGDRPHPRPAARRAGRRARRRGVLQPQPLRSRRAAALPRGAGCRARRARHLGGQDGVRRAGQRSGRPLPRQLRSVRTRGRQGGPGGSADGRLMRRTARADLPPFT